MLKANSESMNVFYNGLLKQTIEAGFDFVKADYASASALLQPHPGEWKVPREGLVLYYWDAQKIIELTRDYEFKLPAFSQKLVHLCLLRDVRK